MTTASYVGREGSVGPYPSQYGQPHVYARDINSGAGNCVCGAALIEPKHVEAAPGVPNFPAAREAAERVREVARHWDDFGPEAAMEFLAATEALVAVLDGAA